MWKYTPASHLPSIDSIEAIGLDTETYDPDLIDGGPGWGRNWGNLVGISISVLGGKAYYFPLGHIVESHDNMPKEEIYKYLQELFLKPIPKVGLNLIYDVGWLMHEGFDIVGPFYDVGFAEALLDPNAFSYSLDTIAKKYLGQTKETDELYKWCADKYRGKPDSKQRANIYRSPPRLVGPYAEADAHLPLQILFKQQILLDLYGLEELFKMEGELIPLLVKMRLRGIPVDLMKANEARDELFLAEEIYRGQLKDIAGFSVNVNSSKDLAKFFDARGLSYPLTEKGNPSFTKPWLNSQHTREAKLITDVRKVQKARSSFIENAVIEKAINNRIYPSLHPLRSEDGGTITGRFSSSKPNSQQLPARDEDIAPIIRGIFVPEDGYSSWLKMDYSQIEYRFFAHYSNDERLIQAYKDDPNTDYHKLIQEEFLDNLLPRKPVKNMNFAILYAAGPDKVAEMLRSTLTEEQVDELLKIL